MISQCTLVTFPSASEDSDIFLAVAIPIADYGLISAAELPSFELVRSVTPSPRNRLGVKGVGEVNIVPVMAAIANAVADAVGRRMDSLPMSPPKAAGSMSCRNRSTLPSRQKIGTRHFKRLKSWLTWHPKTNLTESRWLK